MIGAAGRESVISNYSWGIVAQQLEDIFQEVMESRAPRAN
jgi:glycosyltransferase involved in cell wall biosynthesis